MYHPVIIEHPQLFALERSDDFIAGHDIYMEHYGILFLSGICACEISITEKQDAEQTRQYSQDLFHHVFAVLLTWVCCIWALKQNTRGGRGARVILFFFAIFFMWIK